MNLLEVKKILEEIFNKEPVEGKKRNIVFWYDDEGEFKVKDELELYDFKDELAGAFNNKFRDLLVRLDSSHNFYEAIAMKEESDRLKMRCFEEIKKTALEKRKERDSEKQPVTTGEGNGVYVAKKTVNISIANIFHGAKTIESEEDIEELLDYLRKQLKTELKENTILKLI